ncbi:MAG: metalloregulator ArsR/SmtB family transcription factor [Acidimicrobiia bacterium]|nr:metalloregulator ArsR/SmtB family transcription factor [Acidimicrobiia bacterium]
MDTLQVLAEPKRRQILEMIWDAELPASEIASRFDVTFGAVSQHLRVLREAQLVTVRQDGNRRIYRADKVALEPFREILEAAWRETLSHLAKTIEDSESG